MAEKIKNSSEVKEVVEITKEESERLASVFFEDDEEITLRDGKKYKIAPCTLAEARKLTQLIKTVNVDAIILNFIPEIDEDSGEEITRENDLLNILLMAFKNYPHVDKNYIDNYVDLELAREIIEIMLGINGIKKSLKTT